MYLLHVRRVYLLATANQLLYIRGRCLWTHIQAKWFLLHIILLFFILSNHHLFFFILMKRETLLFFFFLITYNIFVFVFSTSMGTYEFFVSFLILLNYSLHVSHASSTTDVTSINNSLPLAQTIVSRGNVFELGIYYKKYVTYIAKWYKNYPSTILFI